MSNLSRTVALVTGASSGIGRATATLFASRGVDVCLAARRGDLLEELASEIRDGGGRATWVATDVAVREEVERAVAHAVDTFGRLDFGVNVAGIEGEVHLLTDFPEDEWDRVLAVNLRGTFLAMKYEAKSILAGGRGGAIVNVGSVNSFLGVPGGTAYAAAKHGQLGLTTSASAELAPRGIRVNLVCPGIVDTPMHHRLRGAVGDEVYDGLLKGRVHRRRAGRPEEIARAILFLCSEEASYITGTALTADGGLATTM